VSKKNKTEPDEQTDALLASVAELSGVIRSKDEAPAVLQGQVDSQAVMLAEAEELLAQSAALVQEIPELPICPPIASPGREMGLDEAIQVLKDNGFKILTEVKIEDCKDESGQRRRSFRNQGRYEVALVLNKG
jgi:hypothetical protein